MQSSSVNSKVVLAITKQLTQINKKQPDGVKIIINQINIIDIQADIYGPIDTPYFNGVFRCKLVVENDFPLNPPKGYFLTKIFHPNVSEKGEICVNTLKKDWNSSNWSLFNIFQVIKCLLIVPFPQSALNQEAGKQFMEDYQCYFKHAKIMTEVHAMQKTQTIPKKPILSQNQNELNDQKVSPLKKQNDKKKWIKRL